MLYDKSQNRLDAAIRFLGLASLFQAAQTQFCLPSLTVTNGVTSYSGITSRSVATLMCDTGFVLTGTSNATCSPPIWSPDLGTCEPQHYFCPPPPNVTDGQVTFTSASLGSVANITCNTGYVNNGASDMKCQLDGSWTTPGICDLIKICLPSLTVTNGVTSYSGITSGSVATLMCDTGFVLTGTSNVTCSPPIWSPDLGTCEPQHNFCPPPPNVTDGQVTFTSASLGSVANITCNTGYVNNGASDMKCQLDGSWTTPGICDPIRF